MGGRVRGQALAAYGGGRQGLPAQMRAAWRAGGVKYRRYGATAWIVAPHWTRKPPQRRALLQLQTRRGPTWRPHVQNAAEVVAAPGRCHAGSVKRLGRQLRGHVTALRPSWSRVEGPRLLPAGRRHRLTRLSRDLPQRLLVLQSPPRTCPQALPFLQQPLLLRLHVSKNKKWKH